MRSRLPGVQQECHAPLLGTRHAIPFVIGIVAFGHDAARQRRCDLPERFDHRRIERHRRDRAGIAGKHIGDAPHQQPVAVEMALELQQQGRTAGHEIAQFAQRQDAVGRRLEADRLDRGGVHIGKPAAAVGQAAERIVVMHHGLAIGAELQIGLDAVIAGDGRREGRRGVLDRAAGGIMQSAMRNRSRGEPAEIGQLCHLENALDLDCGVGRQRRDADGGAGMAALVAEHFDHQSEAPFITFGPSVKPGAELMKPPSRTHPGHLVEIAEHRLDLGQQVDRAGPRGFLAVFDRHAGAKLALRFEGPFGAETQLAGHDQQVAGAHAGDVIGDRLAGLGRLMPSSASVFSTVPAINSSSMGRQSAQPNS